MSDKLVVEFFQEDKPSNPAAVVLSVHGGDNPASASLTISDFLGAIRANSQGQIFDAHRLASQFIVWNSREDSACPNLSKPEAELIPVSDDYGYQTVRVFACEKQIRVEIVRDEFTTDEEMAEGDRFLKMLLLT